MPVVLERIDIYNFKTYKGKQSFGPFKSLNAVIGPNGVGKSNFMDAVSFVLCENIKQLRVRRYSDLVHETNAGKSTSEGSASVTAVILMENGTRKQFMRSVKGSSTEHQINEQAVGKQQYLEELVELNINVRSQRTLVFQGTIENIAMKSPMELTALFEEISGSANLKKEFEQLKAKMNEAEREIALLFQAKKNLQIEFKAESLQRKEAENIEQLVQTLEDKKVQFQMFQLYHNDNDLKQLKQELEMKHQNVIDKQEQQDMADKQLKLKKKECGKLNHKMAKLETDIHGMESMMRKKQSSVIQAKEQTTYVQNKLKSAKKLLEQAYKADGAKQSSISELEKELAIVNASLRELQLASSPSKDVQLQETQIQQYHLLKLKAQKETAHYQDQLKLLLTEQKQDQDRLNNENRKKSEFEIWLQQKKHAIEEGERRSSRLMETIENAETSLREKQQQLSTIGRSTEQVQVLQKKLEAVMQQLNEAHGNKYDNIRRMKKQEIVKHFKDLNPGVFGRMNNLCQPIDKRYNVAITRVFGKHMDAIVVDTEETAKQCIRYLKEQRLEPEIFLPLDCIQYKPLNVNLRSRTTPNNVRLVYDVLKFSPDVGPAVQFATRNILVCETAEDAMLLAFESGSSCNDAVSLDGTLYLRSGIMCGGSVDLEKKAQVWNETQIEQLKANKADLCNELRTTQLAAGREVDSRILNSQIISLERQLQYFNTEKQNLMKQIEKLKLEETSLQEQLANSEQMSGELEKVINAHEQNVLDIRDKINRVEDGILADFCIQIGIDNIRQYEESDLRTYKDKMQKRLDKESILERILQQLELLKSSDTSTNLMRWKKAVRESEVTLQTAKETEKACMDDVKEGTRELDELKSQFLTKKAEVNALEADIKKCCKKLQDTIKELNKAQHDVLYLNEKIAHKEGNRHTILRECKIQGHNIPMRQGSMSDLIEDTPDSSCGISSGDRSSESLKRIHHEMIRRVAVDYTLLPDFLKEPDISVRDMEQKLKDEIKRTHALIETVKAPDMKAADKCEQLADELRNCNAELNSERQNFKAVAFEFNKIKEQRHTDFMKCFEHVNSHIDTIYKELNDANLASATLNAREMDPYDNGISYFCIAPGKRSLSMSGLSGGERVLASIALLFALNSYSPSPFVILDEMDSALDNSNVNKVVAYIKQHANTIQTILISHKQDIFAHADVLFGISRNEHEDLSSMVTSLDLTLYQ